MPSFCSHEASGSSTSTVPGPTAAFKRLRHNGHDCALWSQPTKQHLWKTWRPAAQGANTMAVEAAKSDEQIAQLLAEVSSLKVSGSKPIRLKVSTKIVGFSMGIWFGKMVQQRKASRKKGDSTTQVFWIRPGVQLSASISIMKVVTGKITSNSTVTIAKMR